MFKKIKNAGKKKEVTIIEEKSNKSSLEPANEKDPRHAKLIDSSEKKERKRSKERERGDKGEFCILMILLFVSYLLFCADDARGSFIRL